MKTDNRTVGGKFEQELSHILAENGFWAHVMQQNKAGQPADIIAVKGKFHTLIDCKVCKEEDFPFSRVEDNQRSAMHRFSQRTGEMCYFAIRYPDGMVMMVSLSMIERMESAGRKSLPWKVAKTLCPTVEEWLKYACVWSEDL